MGCYEGWTWSHPNDFSPSGLLPDEVASVPLIFEPDRWSIAEERIAELIACIQPNRISDDRRNAVASYVQRLVTSCFSCQVFTFGSVPLKTYLPDGDIDLTAFGDNENSKDTWANEVCDMLQSEEKNENAEFCVKEVQYIQAEVKIIKCLVDGIIVDISFNQLGGLCTLCFLEEVDSLVRQNHLFKRSIILIKAWCYYESRILGAHHGLISTYALETLVLYIFHVFNNYFAGPLEVLYRFLEFFSKFDWNNFCVSLWGPIPIRSLPDMTADPPRNDGGALFFSKLFLNACSSVYSSFPRGQENQELPFMSKHFNVIDPLRANNNLGRSVSKGNFFRIRSAFAFGAQRLARLLDCPKENIVAEINQFFRNTFDRHGKQLHTDAPGLRPVNMNSICRYNLGNSSNIKKVKENSSCHESEVEMACASGVSHGVLSQLGNQLLKRLARPITPTSAVSLSQGLNKYSSSTSSLASDMNHPMIHSSNSNENARALNGRSSRLDHFVNELHARFQFARTHSSPELSDMSHQISTQGRHNKASEPKGKIATKLDYDTRRSLGTEVSQYSNAMPSTEDLPSLRESSFQHWIHAPVKPSGASYGYPAESGLGRTGEDIISVAEAMQLQQEEQDFVNMMAASTVPSCNGHVHRSVTHPTPGMTSNQEEILEPIDDNLTSKETCQGDSDHGLWCESDVDSFRGSDVNSGIFQVQHSEEKKNLPPLGSFIPSSSVNRLEIYQTKAHMSFNDNRGPNREDFVDNFVPLSHTTSRIKHSEDSLDGSSMKTSRSTGGRQGRKSAPSVDCSALNENGWQYDTESVDYISSKNDDDNGDLSSRSTVDTEVSENTSFVQQTEEISGCEPVQCSGSKPMFPIAPPLVHPGSMQRMADSNGGLPFAFYPTGPPIPFVTMAPFYSYPHGKGTSDSSTNYIDERFDSTENLDKSDILCSSSEKRDTLAELSEEHSDILIGDFTSHWLNLQHGRLCQNPRDHRTTHFPSTPVIPPMYVQRPLSANTNLFMQIMGYGNRALPVSSPLNGHGHNGEEIRRGRNGTGTYLPNPMSFRDKHSYNVRNKGYSSYDRRDQSCDREGNWNAHSNRRFGGRGRSRNLVEKQYMRVYRRSPSSNGRSDYFPSNQSYNSSFHSMQNGSYSMYPSLPVMNPSGVSPVFMLYPFAQNMASGYGEHLEFGSLGMLQFPGQLGEEGSLNVRLDSAESSSPDNPRLPNLGR